MDYDEGDFQSQNFQLAGVENSKFPSGLRSFALPSFDFDDHLQTHIRFDSLVEPGDILPGQGETNWIENFSPGESAIEFNSNAAESCPILRHNNVWLEATSSESVEMLLKSVGEDDMMEKKIATEPHSGNLLKSLNSNLDNCMMKIDSCDSKMKVPEDNDPASPLAESHGSLPGMHKDPVDALSSVEVEHEAATDGNNSSESSLDLIGGTVVYGHNKYSESISSFSVTSFDNHKLKEPSIDKRCHKGAHKENSSDAFHFGGNATDEHGCSDFSKTSGDPTHHIAQNNLGPSPASSIMDIVMFEQESSQTCTDKELIYETSHMLADFQREKSGTLQTSMEIKEGKASGSFTEPLGEPCDSEKPVDSTIPAVESFSELGYSKMSGGLLEVIVDQVKNIDEGDEMANETSALKENSSATLDKVSNIELYCVSVNKEDTDKPSMWTQETDSSRKVSEAHNVDFFPARSTKLVYDYGKREFESSMMVIEEKQDHGNFQMGSSSNETDVDRGNFHSSMGKTDGKQTSEIREHKKPGPESLVACMDKVGVDLLNHARNAEGRLDRLDEPHQQNVYPSDSCETKIAEIVILAASDRDVNSVELCYPSALEAASGDVSVVSSVTFVTEECPESSTHPGSVDLVSGNCSMMEVREAASVQGQSTSLAADLEGSLEKDVIGKELDITHGVPNSTTLASSGKSKDTCQLFADTGIPEEFADDKELVKPTLPSLELTISDGDHGEPSRISNEIHISSLESDSNLQTANLGGPILDSVPVVLGTPQQLLTTMAVESSHMQNSSQVTLVLHNELQTSTHSDESPEYGIDVERHPAATSLLMEGEPDMLPSEECEKETTSISGDVLHLKDNSSLSATFNKVSDGSFSVEASCVNLSENSCGSPTTISCNDKVLTNEALTVKEGKNSGQSESTGGDLKESNTCADDKSFTFEVGQFSEHSEETATEGWRPFPSTQSLQTPQLGKAISTKSGHDRSDTNVLRETTGGSELVSDEGKLDGVSTKSAGIDRSQSFTGNASASKRKTKEKQTRRKASERSQNPSVTEAASPCGTISRGLQLDDRRQYDPVGGNNVETSCSPTGQASNLPDLNSSTSASGMFNQPFTDSQQVQLRAQIFVYGSLIQGIPPDEACMRSAFGGVDGGRGKWEGIWRVVAEKYDNQKSTLAGCETPAHQVAKTSDQASRRSSLQSKLISASHSRTSNNASPTNFFSSMSLPSPAWSASTHDKLPNMPRQDLNQMLSPLHPRQSPHIRQSTGNGIPWLTQSPSAAPWLAPSHTAAVDTSTHLPALPFTEPVPFMLTRDSSLSHGSNLQFMSSSAFPSTGCALNASSASAMQIDASRMETVPGIKKLASTDQKSRRRKKSTLPEAIGQMPLVSEPQLELDPAVGAPNVTCSIAPANMPTKALAGGVISTISPSISPSHFQIVDGGAEPKIIFSDETYSKIEQANLQAEDAAAFAAAAVRHSEGIWKKLAIQKSSGIVSEVEQTLASAAVAAAAAAAVAKAAAAAAKVAADSALQAKLMADEAMMSGKAAKSPQSSVTGGHCDRNNLSIVSPASILNGKEKTYGSQSIIPVAREAARRRLEAASAAAKQAENLDALVKAAELAAAAVSQAGSVVAMGDPLPLSLSEILEAGPEGYWKAEHSKQQQLVQEVKQSVNFKQPSFNQKVLHETIGGELLHSSNEVSRKSTENHPGDVSGIVSQVIPVVQDGQEQLVVDIDENAIQEGSLVEALFDVKGLGGVWYSARVLELKDSKAFVCYNELLNDEGSDKVKEWISIASEGDTAPRIRAAHPITAKKSEGPRKRRRTAISTYLWDVGDRVDVWINEGWREGVIIEKNQDTTKFDVHFPGTKLCNFLLNLNVGGGETAVVRSWDLRPSLIWRDGQWVAWNHSVEKISKHYEGDTPQQKRQKISKSEGKNNPDMEVLGDRVSENLRSDDLRKLEEFAPLTLSAKERAFSFGQVRREDNPSDRIKRTGLQKDAKVVFGIPKPGKKRKFMDVSRHYVVDNTEKLREGSDSMKFAKYLMPQSSIGWKNVSKVGTRSRRMVEPKSQVLKSAKSRNAQTKSLAEKSSMSVSTLAASNGEENSQGISTSSKAPSGHVDQKLEISFANNTGTGEGVSMPHSHPMLGAPFSNDSPGDFQADEGDIREKSTMNEAKHTNLANIPSKITSDATEPRRSNRRIQPTSRLLEGLQSSLTITKNPSVSHDKGSKTHRTVSSSKGNIRS